MSGKWECLLCQKEIDMWAEKCPYCGENQFGENNEYAPNYKSDLIAKKILYGSSSNKRRKKSILRDPIYTDEEILALGLYPKDEGYKMSLITKILNKR